MGALEDAEEVVEGVVICFFEGVDVVFILFYAVGKKIEILPDIFLNFLLVLLKLFFFSILLFYLHLFLLPEGELEFEFIRKSCFLNFYVGLAD